MKKNLIVVNFLIFLIVLSASNLFAAPNARVAWKFVNLRENPSENAQIITKLVRGVNITILKEDGDWYEVESEEEIKGWVVKRSLKITGSLNLAPDSVKKPAVKKPGVTVIRRDPAKKPATKKETASAKKHAAKKPAKPSKESEGEFVTFSEKYEDEKAATAVKPELNIEGTLEDQIAEGYLKTPDTSMPELPSLTGAFFKMISALFIILGIILLLYYIVKKYFSNSLMFLEGASAISVLASKYVGQKTTIHVIDLMEKVIVVAISGSDITMLTEISEPASMNRMRKEISTLRESEKPFKKFFSDRIKTGPSFSSPPKEESFDMLDEINDKLEKKVDDFKI